MKYLIISFVFSFSVSLAQDNAFHKVNSSFDEQNPVVSPDGKTLFLTIANHPQNVGGKKDPGDIWYSLREATGWSQPIHGGLTLNSAGFNAVAGFSTQGDEMYLLSHYKQGGTATTQGISVTRRASTGWSTPENISIPYFLNRSANTTGQYYAGLSAVVLSIESYNTIGAEDIYVTIQRDGRWGELINLGKVINTSFQEVSPSLSSDGKRLFFASNGRKGFGSFDIYESERLDDTWLNWSEPRNLGANINSEGRELYYRDVIEGITLYTTTQNSDGYGDIRMVSDSMPPIFEMKTPDEVSQEVESGVIIKGTITNSKTGEPLIARLNFKSDTVYTVLANNSGNYLVRVTPLKSYAIEVSVQGYVSVSEKLDIKSVEMKQVELNFKLQPIEVGAVINLRSVLFELGATALLEESYDELNVVVDFLKQNPKVEIELEGHTDNRGDAKKNVLLSQQRVDKIKSYLVTNGIGAKRIKGKGFGGSRPIATNDSEEARKLNRRVEFRILRK
jgi:outer membrane protein OmpA-like peptidoglycan-associated protein